MAWTNDSKSTQLGLYYLRVGLGFITLWSAWDVIVHKEQINAFFASFPLIGALSGQIMLLWFLILFAAGVLLLTGWYFREAAAVVGALLLLSLLLFSFMTPKVNAVLGPFRPLALKSLVWLGACLVLITHETDPFNPERRHTQGYAQYAGRAQLAFRILLGGYLLWDGLLKAVNANGYLTLLTRALNQVPLFPDSLGPIFMVVLYIAQLLAGLMILTGIKFRWALLVVMIIALIQLIGVNWFATRGLLRAGGRFMLRDIIVLTSVVYFWLAGPGRPVLQIKVAGGITSPPPSSFPTGDQDTTLPPMGKR